MPAVMPSEVEGSTPVLPFGGRLVEADPKTLASLATVTLGGKTETFRPFYAVGKAVFEGSGEAIAAARDPEEARRIAAALNSAFGIPTDALEAWSIGSIQDPVNDVLAEIESVLAPPRDQDRRGDRGPDRRQTDRRRPIHEVRIEKE
jgi:hypothetical protein